MSLSYVLQLLKNRTNPSCLRHENWGVRVLTRTSEMGLKPLHLGKRALCNKNVKEMTSIGDQIGDCGDRPLALDWGFVKTSNAPMALRGQIHQEFYFIIASPVILERELWLSSLLNRKADSNYLSC